MTKFDTQIHYEELENINEGGVQTPSEKETNKMKSYQGYRSWNAYNVSLWMSNDYNLYLNAQAIINHVTDKIKRHPMSGKIYSIEDQISIATSKIFRFINGAKFSEHPTLQRTPDGASYNYLSIKGWVQEEFAEIEETELQKLTGE